MAILRRRKIYTEDHARDVVKTLPVSKGIVVWHADERMLLVKAAQCRPGVRVMTRQLDNGGYLVGAVEEPK